MNSTAALAQQSERELGLKERLPVSYIGPVEPRQRILAKPLEYLALWPAHGCDLQVSVGDVESQTLYSCD